MFTQDQLLNLKYYARELSDSATIAYWATDKSDKGYHVKNVIRDLEKLVELYKESK
jgi:hypothetical protein